MSEKHSPGPWKWVSSDDDVMPKLVDANGHNVCDFGEANPYDQCAGDPPNDADARLIAAAPEMAELLRDMDKHAVCLMRRSESCGQCWTCRARALLKRIDG